MVPLPEGKFDVILMDPPWSHYGKQDKWGAAAKFYSLMDDDALRCMPVGHLAKRETVVFCWATCPRLDFAIDLLRHWGFHYRGVAFTWVKTTKCGRPIGARGVRPSIVKPTTEFVLAASMTAKGRPMPISDEGVAQVVLAAPTRHSEKPEEVYSRIERLYPRAQKLEMFARGRRDGWMSWGDDPSVVNTAH